MKKEQVIKEIIGRLSFTDFGFDEFKILKNNSCIYFYRKRFDRIDVVSVHYFLRKSKMYIANSVPNFVVFKEINTILQKVIPDINIENQMVISDYPNWEKNEDKISKIAGIVILDKEVFFEENLNGVINVIREYIIEYALPFFDKVIDLKNVHDNIVNVIPQMQLGNYIGSEYMSSMKQIIMKLYKDPNYDDYVVWLANTIEQMGENKSIFYEEKNKVFRELNTVLEDI
jgi:hypothetical protein